MTSPHSLQALDSPPDDLPASGPGWYERLRRRITGWAERQGSLSSHATNALLTLPDLFRLLCGLALDPDVAPRHKTKLTLAILYIASPIDFFPAALFGPAGHLDDVVVAVMVLNRLLNDVDDGVIERHWKGDGDAIKTIRHFAAVADELVGSGLLRRIQRFLEG